MSFGRSLARLFALHHLRDCPDVFLRRTAASAHKIQPSVVDKFFKLRGERGRRFQVFTFFIRQTGVRIARHIRVRKLAQRSNVIGHELRTSRTIHPESQRLGVSQRSPQRFHRLPRQHRTHRLNRDRHDKRHLRANFFRKLMNRQNR